MRHCVVAFGILGIAALAHGQDSWADQIIDYDPGSNPPPGYTDPSTSLGEPTRFTGVASGFPGAVTPFNSPFEMNELVSIGEGGSLTVAFDEPVINDAANPFGIDLLIFGNAFYWDNDWPNGNAGALASEGGVVEVSDDGQNWFLAPGVDADGAFPTLGYLDLPGAYSDQPGSVLSDFTRPVDPAFDATGFDFVDIVAAYSGSGGGVGIDIGALGLSQISFVRITNPIGSGFTPEIDAFADVSAIPAPGPMLMLTVFASLARGRRSRREQLV